MTVYCVQYSLQTQMPSELCDSGSLLKTMYCNGLLVLRVVLTVHSLSSVCRVVFLTIVINVFMFVLLGLWLKMHQMLGGFCPSCNDNTATMCAWKTVESLWSSTQHAMMSLIRVITLIIYSLLSSDQSQFTDLPPLLCLSMPSCTHADCFLYKYAQTFACGNGVIDWCQIIWLSRIMCNKAAEMD